jgi:hypothetical protein
VHGGKSGGNAGTLALLVKIVIPLPLRVRRQLDLRRDGCALQHRCRTGKAAQAQRRRQSRRRRFDRRALGLAALRKRKFCLLGETNQACPENCSRASTSAAFAPRPITDPAVDGGEFAARRAVAQAPEASDLLLLSG